MNVIRLATQEEAEESVGEEAADRTGADEASPQPQPDASNTTRRH